MGIPLLSVCLLTYNHVKYIKESIDSVLMQKVNFSWELIIADDFSTDGTRAILLEYKKKYPNLIKLILQEHNVGPLNNFKDLLNAPKSKYIAYFEGDDYWTDPYKLQRQVDFLEENPDYGMTYTKVQFFIQKKGKFSDVLGGNKETFEELLLENTIPALTTCFKSDLWRLYMEEISPLEQNWLMGDYPLWLYISYKSKINFETAITGVYRVLENSASHSTDLNKSIAFIKSYFEIGAFFIHKYCPDNDSIIRSFDINHSWTLFRLWGKYRLPQLIKQVEEIIKYISDDQSIKLRIMRMTISLPFFKYLFFIYDRSGVPILGMKMKQIMKYCGY
jgi:glycosyltransferase involved in cell wall biosynthesis